MKYLVVDSKKEDMMFKGFDPIKGYSIWTYWIDNAAIFDSENEANKISQSITNSKVINLKEEK